MSAQIDIEAIDNNIKTMKKAAEELSQMGDDFPAIKRNTARILASIKMLEINVSDIIDL
ncbi:MAG TPA: hypothetical protein HPQ03_15230 [Deltaproteobacteria bacterium]|nr:hypothetical protein [Deltaproteobacteria bacterium]